MRVMSISARGACVGGTPPRDAASLCLASIADISAATFGQHHRIDSLFPRFKRLLQWQGAPLRRPDAVHKAATSEVAARDRSGSRRAIGRRNPTPDISPGADAGGVPRL